MPRELLHIYGPFSIQWYGVMILLGIILFIWRASRNPIRKKYLSSTQFTDLITYSIIVGIVGGRLLNIASEWNYYHSIADIFKIWEGGFSILGTILAVVIFAPWYLHRHKIPILPVLDLCALYAPLLQAVARIGCFFAGCCHGIATTAPWAIICENPTMPELLGLPVHPTQLYSSAVLFIIFLIQRYIVYSHAKHQGQLLGTYLMLVGLERFILDIWRAHRVATNWYFSGYQLIALLVIALGLAIFIFCTFVRPTKVDQAKKHEHL